MVLGLRERSAMAGFSEFVEDVDRELGSESESHP